MTNQRFSLSRMTLSGLLVLAACVAHAQDSAYNPNPFQASKATAVAPASTTTSVSSPELPPPTTSRVGADTGPLTLPPPIPVPLPIAVPLDKLPKAATPRSATPMAPPPPVLAEAENDAAPAPGKTPTAGAQAGTPKVRAFLPREKIEANRARCQVGFKGRNLIQLAAGEAEQTIQMTGANGCLTAISADADWLDVEYRGNNELVLVAHANTGTSARRGQVTVVTPNQTFVLTVRQAVEPAEPVRTAKDKASGVEPSPAKNADAAPVSMPAPAEPDYDAAKVRLADVSDQPLPISAALKSLAGREPALISVAEMAPLTTPVPEFTLPELVEPKLELRSLTMLQERTPVLAEVVPTLTVPTPQFELPEVRGAPLELKSLAALQKETPPLTIRAEDLAPLPVPSFSLPDVAVQVQPLKSLVALRNLSPSVAILSADQRQLPPVSLSLPAISASVAKVGEPATQAPAQQATPAVDPARAKSIVEAVLSATEPTFGESPVAAPVKPAPTRPSYVPPGYVTLDEYTTAPAAKDSPKPEKKRTK